MIGSPPDDLLFVFNFVDKSKTIRTHDASTKVRIVLLGERLTF